MKKVILLTKVKNKFTTLAKYKNIILILYIVKKCLYIKGKTNYVVHVFFLFEKIKKIVFLLVLKNDKKNL
jgi:hypothetical protein